MNTSTPTETLQATHITCFVQDLAGALKHTKPGSIIEIGDPHRGREKDERVEILSHPQGIVIHTFRIKDGQPEHQFWLNGSFSMDSYEEPSLPENTDVFSLEPEGIRICGMLIPKKFREIRAHDRGFILLGGEGNREVCIVVLSQAPAT